MSHLSHALADHALQAAANFDADALRVRLLANFAAAIGFQTETVPLTMLFSDAERSSDTAFLYAALMHARTQDDFYPPGKAHIGASVLPAVIAVGGDEVVFAGVAAGYSVMCLVARAYSPVAQSRGWRPTGVFGAIGAAAGAAVALGLSRAQIASAIGFAASTAGGTNRAWLDGSDEWLLHVASAARNGLESALFSRAGMASASLSIEGRSGWANVYFGDEDAAALRRELEGGVVPAGMVALKPFPVSGIAQSPTWASAQVHSSTGGAPIQSVEVRMNPQELAYPGSQNRGPFSSRSDSLMSVARCVAIALSRGTVGYSDLARPIRGHEERLLKLIELIPDPTLEETECRVVVSCEGFLIEQHAFGTELLYPSWETLSNDVSELARRSEASEASVQDARRLIAGSPTSRNLADLLRTHISGV